MRNITVQTSHGTVAARESDGRGLPLVMLHGNSACQDVFLGQMRHPVARQHRIITLDLPGHGMSQDAVDPLRTYTLPGYADAVIETLAALRVDRAVLFGWSLGGHIALEALARWSGVAGVAITGAPPARCGIEGLLEAFQPNAAFALLSQPNLNDEQVAQIAQTMVDEANIAMLERAIRRTDGAARQVLFDSLTAGEATDERVLVESCNVPLAVIDGKREPFADPAYLESICFKALWRGALVQIPEAAHAPFLENPDSFNAHLLEFLRDVKAQQPNELAA